MKAKVLIALSMLFAASCSNVPTREESLDETQKETSHKINQNQTAFQTCIRDAVKRTPGLKGQATLVWIQNDEGYVRNPRIRDMNFKDAEFENCILSQIKSMRFPPSAEDSRTKVSLDLIVQ
ncbi:AgmX/PglI C-terminal domain-containing protein [Bdellovibrio sp. HCB-110]|uniref:AgmX/PglI C-terminal domain-containing protein n=1 Tax=Bdellovibrio sp. HCB-110 TaxID=3391182 RepID=UPI0039B49347